MWLWPRFSFVEKRRRETSERPSDSFVHSSASQQGGKDGAESKQELLPCGRKRELSTYAQTQ